MATKQERLNRVKIKLDAAKDAIETVFSDTSVSQEDTIYNLAVLQEEIESKIEAIKSDIRRKLDVDDE